MFQFDLTFDLFEDDFPPLLFSSPESTVSTDEGTDEPQSISMDLEKALKEVPEKRSVSREKKSEAQLKLLRWAVEKAESWSALKDQIRQLAEDTSLPERTVYKYLFDQAKRWGLVKKQTSRRSRALNSDFLDTLL